MNIHLAVQPSIKPVPEARYYSDSTSAIELWLSVPRLLGVWLCHAFISLYLLYIILFIIVNKNCLFLPIRCILATQPLIPPSTPSHIDHPHIKNAPTSVNGAWEVIVQFIGNVKQSCNYADFILFGKCWGFDSWFRPQDVVLWPLRKVMVWNIINHAIYLYWQWMNVVI